MRRPEVTSLPPERWLLEHGGTALSTPPTGVMSALVSDGRIGLCVYSFGTVLKAASERFDHDWRLRAPVPSRRGLPDAPYRHYGYGAQQSAGAGDAVERGVTAHAQTRRRERRCE